MVRSGVIERQQQEKRRHEKLQRTGTHWQYHEKKKVKDRLDVCTQAVGPQEKEQPYFFLPNDVFNHTFFGSGEEADSEIMWFEGYFIATKGAILKRAVFVTESLDRLKVHPNCNG